MEDLTLRYFDAEMRYLREAAKEFAQTHPDRAAMLDLDKAGTPSGDVRQRQERRCRAFWQCSLRYCCRGGQQRGWPRW